MCRVIWLLLLQICLVLANTEKVIFLGPSSVQVPDEHPTLEDLNLDALSPNHWSLRTYLQAEFPINSSKYGQATWLLLHGLKEGQRYEVRVCWAATQPTSFRLDTYELYTVFETPELITSLAQYSESRHAYSTEAYEQKHSIGQRRLIHTKDDASSTLFLQLFAAADYFTTNQTLMNEVPPVYVDIILDPFVFNVLPRSLVPTVAYIFMLAIASWFLAKYTAQWLQAVAKLEVSEKKNS